MDAIQTKNDERIAPYGRCLQRSFGMIEQIEIAIPPKNAELLKPFGVGFYVDQDNNAVWSIGVPTKSAEAFCDQLISVIEKLKFQQVKYNEESGMWETT